ncbi:hypothetical protein DE146DRAFT_126050 [Phaeosphaeria sp. MPI-PUGE-AT-0046c]|nr:hypothetical protein DE146DRAFT_126050 [Phaeosphaeria sp. MPI-PUGE-AT-0046c]
MVPNSPIFVESVEFEREPSNNTRRARSNEDLDFLKEQDRWHRHDQARQMVRYRDRNHFGATQQRTRPAADRLAVPVYEVSPRRPRARSDTRSPYDLENLPRDFTTLDVRPSPRVDDDNRVQTDRLEAKERGSTQSRDPHFEKPRIKIPPVVVQEHPPGPRTPDGRAGKSPSSRSRSPSGQPQLQYKYLLLQNKLADISLACVRYIDVEAANPRDLTFEKISEQVKGFTFDLQVWHHVANIEHMARRDVPEAARGVVDAASRNLERLIERATELHDACNDAAPGDLKFVEVGKVNDDDDLFGNDGDEQDGNDSTESIGLFINASLHSIKLQIQNLKRLSRALQEATPGAKEEMAAVSSLVGDVGRYFGTDEAVHQNGVDKKFSGRRALQEARYAAAR